MTTEDLGEGDHHAKLVYADYLEDRDDPRAEGFRVLGTLQLDVPEEGWFRYWVRSPVGISARSRCPRIGSRRCGSRTRKRLARTTGRAGAS